MMTCSTSERHNFLKQHVDEILSNTNNFTNAEMQQKFNKYYTNEWVKYTEKWAGHITSNIVKKGMFSLQPLDLAFNTIDSNLSNFEKGYKDIENGEKYKVDVRVSLEPRLGHLIGKVTRRALIFLCTKRLRKSVDISSPCSCQCRLNYGLPFFHILQRLEIIMMENIPSRWWFERKQSSIRYEECSVEGETLEVIQQPWEDCLAKVEQTFRSFDGNSQSISQFIRAIESVMNIMIEDETYVDELSLRLPSNEDVKSPGRPKKTVRLSALRKDHAEKTASKLAIHKVELENDDDEEVLDVKGMKREADEWVGMPERTKRRKIDLAEENENFSKLHSSIDKSNVKAVYDPVGDSYCGFRAIAFLHYGDENKFQLVKKDMMLAFEKNKEYYAKILGHNVVELKITISRGLKDATESAIWFKNPSCAQVVTDAYNLPVCVYNCPLDTSRLGNPMTFLSVSMPVRPKVKVQPYLLQNVKNKHWLALKFGYLQTKYPPVTHMYFNIDDSYETLFKTTWNLFGQFPKFRSSDEPKGEPEMIQLLVSGTREERDRQDRTENE
ncbi:hypothetical protein INT47_002915 [Mucor saturninus]|uniref:OTU domain-containing protein n=1 Tax=Mucor saturninus TaxID=64648 RepID=A0A8H7URI1_9FUNG|nr:hypothetical protein INT47_002915 [Mucor saturninus]